MLDESPSRSTRFRAVCVGLLIASSLLFLVLLLLAARDTMVNRSLSDSGNSTNSGSISPGMSNNPNAVSGAFSGFASSTEQAVDATEDTLLAGARLAGSAAAGMGRLVAGATTFVGRGVGSGVSYAAHGIANGVSLLIQTPGRVLSSASKAPVVSSIITPPDSSKQPIIDDKIIAQVKLAAAVSAVQQAEESKNQASWPIRGQITTYFGVPHWPYQPTHTGIDISDGWRSGITAVHPYKPGRVVETVYSRVGLGNHVAVDHGGGITSVYGHLASIAVTNGQEVTKLMSLGTEGSTGASTGTHVHFEIRVNGTAVNPFDYVNGLP